MRGRLYRKFFKRLIDAAFVLVTLPISVPIMLIFGLLVALDGHNPFYRQDRVGRNGRIFRIRNPRNASILTITARAFMARNGNRELIGPKLWRMGRQPKFRAMLQTKALRLGRLPCARTATDEWRRLEQCRWSAIAVVDWSEQPANV